MSARKPSFLRGGHRICNGLVPDWAGTPAPQPCWFPNDADATVCRKCGARLT